MMAEKMSESGNVYPREKSVAYAGRTALMPPEVAEEIQAAEECMQGRCAVSGGLAKRAVEAALREVPLEENLGIGDGTRTIVTQESASPLQSAEAQGREGRMDAQSVAAKAQSAAANHIPLEHTAPGVPPGNSMVPDNGTTVRPGGEGI